MSAVFKELGPLIKSKSDAIVESEYDNVCELAPNIQDVDQWNFPIIFEGKAYVDTRPYRNAKGDINNKIEYGNAMMRALLELEWETNREGYQNMGPMASSVFGTWIAKLLTRRYNRSIADGVRIKAAFTMLYLSYLMPDDERTIAEIGGGELENVFLRQISRYTDIPSRFITDEVLAEDGDTPSLSVALGVDPKVRLSEVVKWLNERMESPIDELSDLTMITLVTSGSWVGHLSGELTYLSLYHPPIFMSLLQRVAQTNFYDRLPVGQAVRDSRQVKIKSITGWIENLADEAKE